MIEIVILLSWIGRKKSVYRLYARQFHYYMMNAEHGEGNRVKNTML